MEQNIIKINDLYFKVLLFVMLEWCCTGNVCYDYYDANKIAINNLIEEKWVQIPN